MLPLGVKLRLGWRRASEDLSSFTPAGADPSWLQFTLLGATAISSRSRHAAVPRPVDRHRRVRFFPGTAGAEPSAWALLAGGLAAVAGARASALHPR